MQLLLLVCLAITALEIAQGWSDYQRAAALVPGTDAFQVLSAKWSGTSPTPALAPSAPSSSPSPEAPIVGLTPDRAQVLEWLGWVANLLLAVPYFMWLHRTSINCRNFTSIMHFKPAETVGSYFIPLLNLFRPCQTMQEIWRVSRNPRTWHNDRGSALVIAWWVLTLAVVFGAVEISLLSWTAATRDDRVLATFFFALLKAVQLVWYGIFLALVTLIIRRQALAVRLSRERHAGPA